MNKELIREALNHMVEVAKVNDWPMIHNQLSVALAELDKSPDVGGGWIPVETKLPEEGLTVLVWSPTCLMHSMRYYPTSAYPWRDNDPEDHDRSFSTIPDVTHWRELPPPPKP